MDRPWGFWQLPESVKYWISEGEKDCYFIVGPDGQSERIGASKIFLMGYSAPFRAMLKGDLAEQGDIRITDVEPEIFHIYLKCCYGGSDIVIQQLNFEEMLKLLYMTDKYLAKELTDKIFVHLKVLFSFSNLYTALSHPICFHYEYLENKLSEILKFNFKEMVMDTRFLELNATAIAWILQQNSFTVKEIDIWNATVQWAKHKTGSTDGEVLRSYMFDLLKYFRFLTMEHTEFWNNVVSCKILLEEEVIDICNASFTGDPVSIDYLSQNTSNRYNIAAVSEDIHSKCMEFPINNAFICCSVKLVSSLGPWRDSKCSTTYPLAGYLWMVKVKKIKSNNATKSYKKRYALSVFVVCRGQSTTWNCSADVVITLFNQSENPDVSKKYTKTFTEMEYSRGFDQFQDWSELIDPDNGFVQGNTITLMVKIQLRN